MRLLNFILLLSLLAPLQARALAQTPPPMSGPVSLETAYGTSFNVMMAGRVDAPLAVLLVPGRWGLNGELQAWLPVLAGADIRVLALDLFDGRPVRNRSMALEVWRSVDPVWMAADLDGAVNYLSQDGANVVVMSWHDSVPHAGQLLARQPGKVQGMITVGRRIAADVPMLRLNKADQTVSAEVRKFLQRWQ